MQEFVAEGRRSTLEFSKAGRSNIRTSLKCQAGYVCKACRRQGLLAPHAPHMRLNIHFVGMQIADVKDSEIVKCRGKIGESHAIFFDNDVVSVSTCTAVKSSQLRRRSDNPRRCVPVFKIENDQSLSKQLGLMLDFDFQSPLNMF